MNQYVPIVAPLSKNDIEQDATLIAQRFFPMTLLRPSHFPILKLFESLEDEYGLDPGVECLSDGVEGMTYPDGRVLVSEETYRGLHNGEPRPRFTVAHEVYHGIRHRDQIRKALADTGEIVLYRRPTIEAFRDPEWQANTFAGALLMPAPMVRMLAKKKERWLLPATMANEFGVSNQAAEVRLAKLRI